MSDESQVPVPPPSAPRPKRRKVVVSAVKEEIDVDVVADENGTVKSYVLREMDSPVRDEWIKIEAGRMSFSKDGKPVPGQMNVTDKFADLISRCLFYGEGPRQGKPVPIEEVRLLPSQAQLTLYEEAETLNGLTKKSQDELKKA